MNCATPCAPLWLTARGLNLLSCQIKRVKNSIGSSLAAAADCTAKQMDSRLGGSPGADDCDLAAPSFGGISDPSDDRLGFGTADWEAEGDPEFCSTASETLGAPPARHRASTQEIQPGKRMAGVSAHSLPTCGSRPVAAACRTRAPRRSAPARGRRLPAGRWRRELPGHGAS